MSIVVDFLLMVLFWPLRNLYYYHVLNLCQLLDLCFEFSAGDKIVIIWDPQTGNLLHKLEGHNRYVTCCVFSSDNRFLATGSNDKAVIIWHISNMKDRDIIIVNDESKEANSYTNAALIASESNVVSEWKVNDVTKWLERLELGKYSHIFRDNSIDGIELLHLTQDSLLTALRIGKL